MNGILSVKLKLCILLLIVTFGLFACGKEPEPEPKREADYTQIYAYASVCLLYPMDLTITEYDQGIEFMEKGQFFEASASMEAALEKQKKEHPKNKLVEGKILSALGVCDIALFKNQRAEERLRRALELISAETGSSSDETAVAYNNLASVLISQKKFDESMNFLLQSERIGQENATLTQENIDCITINKASNLGGQQNHIEATEIYKQKLESLEENSNKRTLLKAFLKGQIAFIDSSNLGLSASIKYCENTIDVFKELADVKHPQIASTYMPMGLIYLEYNQTDKAIELINKALNIEKNSLSSNPAIVAQCYSNLGICYINKQEIDRAMGYCNMSLKILMKYKELKTDLATTYNNIGVLYAYNNNLERSEIYLLKAYWTVYGDVYSLVSQEKYRSSVKIVYEALGKDPAEFDAWLEQQKNNKDILPDAT